MCSALHNLGFKVFKPFLQCCDVILEVRRSHNVSGSAPVKNPSVRFHILSNCEGKKRVLNFRIVVYISGRPFVLRDSAAPRSTLHMSDRVENLEAIEMRLKLDILTEAAK